MPCLCIVWVWMSVPGHPRRLHTCEAWTSASDGWTRTTCAAADEGRHRRYDYAALVFDFACRLVYDESGLALDYPGIAVRAF
jgi:hypothetical protein